MALPGDVLSTTHVSDGFSYAQALPITPNRCYEDGGIALNDPSQGLFYQIWKAEIIKNKDTQQTEIWVEASEVTPFLWRAADGITFVSITFDQNMRLHVVWTEQDVTYLYWYDSLIANHTTTNYGSYITPYITLDDKRELESDVNDILFFYLKTDGKLYYRQQRDRFTVEREIFTAYDAVPIPNKPTQPGIIKAGMGRGLRMQIMLRQVR